MKLKIKNYSFNKTAKTITFSDYATIKLDGIFLVVNVTRNIEIYNPLKTAKGGTVATNVLTLAYDTSTMANSDKLMIMYEDDAQSMWDKLVQIYGYLGTMMSNFGGWWDTASGWYAEVAQARQTARNITDTKGIPALDKINGDTLPVAPFGHYYYTNDSVTGYYDLKNISINYYYYFKKGDKVLFTGLDEWAMVESVSSSGYITLVAALSTIPSNGETLQIYRKVNVSFDSDGIQQVSVSGGGSVSSVEIVKNKVSNIASGSLYFSYYGQYVDFYNIEGFEEIAIRIQDNTGWSSYGCQIEFEASTNGGYTWQTYISVYNSAGYSTSSVYLPGTYLFPVGAFNAFRCKSGYTTNGSVYANIYLDGKPIGKFVQKVEISSGGVNASCTQSTSPWKVGPYITNLYNNTTALAANATLTGSAMNVTALAEVYFSIFTLQDSADNGLILEQGYDTTTWYPIIIPEKVLAMVAGQNREFIVPVTMNYFRFRYTNGTVATGTPFAVRVFGTGIPSIKQATDRNGNSMIRQPDLPTYSACTAVFTPGGNTDVWDFFGVANREIQIQKIIVSGIATAGTLTNAWSIQKKATANSGGTATNPNKVPLSSTMTPSTAVIRSYTVSPTTLGTVLGDIWKKAVYIPTSAGINNTPLLELDFSGNTGLSPITLNTALEGISLNLGGVTIGGLQLQVTVLYTESFYL